MTPRSDADNLANEVKAAANAVAARVKEIREDIHAHPELRYQERRTAALCAEELRSLGIEVTEGVGQTGVVGVLRGGAISSGACQTVGFRAEMDALPTEDLCGHPWQSTNPGVGHHCGHDGHVAALLGTARVLAGMRDRLEGNVKFLFEPAEEATPDDEIAGSTAMINDGALDDPRPDAIFACHFYPEWPAGSIAMKVGSSFSGNDYFELTVKGKESHSAVPWKGIDAIVVAAQVISALQSFTARQLDIEEAASLTVGTISGGRASNILAETVEMTGTVRISSEEIRDDLPAMIERTIKGVCESFGAEYDLKYFSRHLPAVICTQAEVDLMRSASIEVLGREHVIEMRHPRLAADTVHEWLDRVPGVFFMVGSAGESPDTRYPSHHQRFNIADETWPAVVAAESMTAIRYLQQARSE
ncbi:MAG: amidohydrolase [Chloroflexi bacterium]|nr:amidohydrolase [Chloroflexota bacterium]